MDTADAFDLSGVSLDHGGGGATLAGRVAAVLLQKIREGGLSPGARLPTEHVMAQRFGVSRTVIREAIVTLKAEGLVETRQGSGAFVRRPVVRSAFSIDAFTSESVHHLLRMIEVRRAIDSETAALAAVRRDAQQIDEIRRAMAAIDTAVSAGGDGVREDVEFHLCIARATGNPYWVKLMEMFAPQLRAAVSVTRANEARRKDFAQAVKVEHQRLVDAIIAGNAATARAAAADHMERASERVATADHDFWASEGKEHAQLLVREQILESGGGNGL
jgi:DNA-binding FadR family transcriptional regulator